MSRADHQILRGQKVATHFRDRGRPSVHEVNGKFQMLQPTRQPWWPSRFAELVERRGPDGTYEPRVKDMLKVKPPRIVPEMLPRPGDMTRQTHRRLFREACTAAGVDYRTAKKA